MKILTSFFLSVLLISCASKRNINNYDKFAFGGVAVSKNFYCDQTEVTNFHWLEYLYWLENVYGENSQQYLSALPDSNTLESHQCKLGYPEEHFRRYEYRDYPIVGITQQQAIDYSQWRSDRVFENYLITNEIIRFNSYQTKYNHFSIENYFSGRYSDQQDSNGVVTSDPIVPNLELRYPVYALPSAEERIQILDYVDSTDYTFHQKRPKKYEVWREEYLPFQLAISTCPKTPGTQRNDQPLRSTVVVPDPKNKFNLIYDIRGNVAEWGDDPYLTYGGGWPHNIEYVLSKDTISSYSPNAWTGFRNVWSWKKWRDNE